MLDLDAINQLKGTSTDKARELLGRVRSDGRASFVLGVMERIPGEYGHAVKFLLREVPEMDPKLLDEAIRSLADAVLALLSDPPPTVTSIVSGRYVERDTPKALPAPIIDASKPIEPTERNTP